MTYPQGECSYRGADSVGRINVGPELVLNTPPAMMPCSAARRPGACQILLAMS